LEIEGGSYGGRQGQEKGAFLHRDGGRKGLKDRAGCSRLGRKNGERNLFGDEKWGDGGEKELDSSLHPWRGEVFFGNEQGPSKGYMTVKQKKKKKKKRSSKLNFKGCGGRGPPYMTLISCGGVF